MSRHNDPSRRQVMSWTASAAAVAAGLSALQPLLAEPEKRAFKVGVCEWMLGKNSPASFDVCAQIGVEGMQANMGNLANDMQLRKADVRKQYKEASKRTGVAISSIGIAEMNNVPLKSDDRAEKWLYESIDVANDFGVRVILLGFFFKNDLKGDRAGTDRVVEVLRKAAPSAERAGVVYGIESWLSGAEHMEVIDRVGSPAVQCYYDVGNSHLKGYDIYREIRELGRHVCEHHAKDYGNIFGQGKVDFAEVRRAMDDAGYRGWIQIEGASPKGLVPSYREDLAYLKKVFPAAG